MFRYAPLATLAACLLILVSTSASLAKSTKNEGKGNVAAEVVYRDKNTTGNGSAADSQAVVAAITRYWQRYLAMDKAGLSALLASDVTRLSERANGPQQGRDAVLAALPAEWEAFEKANGEISEKLTIQHLDLRFAKGGGAVTALYWLDVVGGGRWRYDDQALVMQAFRQDQGVWQLVHQTDAWSLDYDPSAQEKGKATFAFDYVYPVEDLKRAIEFYTPLLGKPEGQSSSQAVYNFRGMRFILDTNDLGGFAKIKDGLPNGYAVFHVKDVAATRDRLLEEEVEFVAGTDEKLLKQGNDLYVIGLDYAENVFVLKQITHSGSAGVAPGEPANFTGTDPYSQAARQVARAWLKMDSAAMAKLHGNGGKWFDSSRLKTRGIEQGGTTLAKALASAYWPRYDHNNQGLIADLRAQSLHQRQIGGQTLVSYQMNLIGRGNHPFQDSAYVTHLFERPDQVAATLIVPAQRRTGQVLDLDYTGYPVDNLSDNEEFYSKILKLGSPYKDDSWRGYWSDQAVFGIYTADKEEDGIPKARRSNGYMSFWVHSAQETYEYLQDQEVDFPLLPAISEKRGLDPEPGYIQAVATDSEGNLVIFTEYTGRRH